MNQLTPAERALARQTWDLLADGDLEGFEQFRSAPETIRDAIIAISGFQTADVEPEKNPFT